MFSRGNVNARRPVVGQGSGYVSSPDFATEVFSPKRTLMFYGTGISDNKTKAVARRAHTNVGSKTAESNPQALLGLRGAAWRSPKMSDRRLFSVYLSHGKKSGKERHWTGDKAFKRVVSNKKCPLNLRFLRKVAGKQ